MLISGKFFMEWGRSLASQLGLFTFNLNCAFIFSFTWTVLWYHAVRVQQYDLINFHKLAHVPTSSASIIWRGIVFAFFYDKWNVFVVNWLHNTFALYVTIKSNKSFLFVFGCPGHSFTIYQVNDYFSWKMVELGYRLLVMGYRCCSIYAKFL